MEYNAIYGGLYLKRCYSTELSVTMEMFCCISAVWYDGGPQTAYGYFFSSFVVMLLPYNILNLKCAVQ